jgi:hypothetical protein
MNFEELLTKLNSLDIIQKSICWIEDLPEDLYDKEFDSSYTELINEINIDKHRHYELSTDVILIKGRILGIRYVSNLYSEQSSCSDIYHTLEFFEMKEVQTISYATL